MEVGKGCIHKSDFMKLSVMNIRKLKELLLSKTTLEKYNISDKIELILAIGYIILKHKAESRKWR
ncbi:hypothetical protein SAMN04487894_12615 [Niabella drilacis]|uniref:Uncharacterized protein n=1 Tax=Niabella drilacis (strain DSM 25811 / CCM 8410 / CCUG 62505 / LMG 26954 / E90) TaxID=1285928 RepID=A0A1G7AZG1_NIADE|nr:hypothetical protein SAMN04487894_12615 [Niabella drilacis]